MFCEGKLEFSVIKSLQTLFPYQVLLLNYTICEKICKIKQIKIISWSEELNHSSNIKHSYTFWESLKFSGISFPSSMKTTWLTYHICCTISYHAALLITYTRSQYTNKKKISLERTLTRSNYDVQKT